MASKSATDVACVWAITAGGVALILGRNPSWTPDQVKYALSSTAHQIGNVSSTYQGAGEIKLSRAAWANVSSAPVQDLQATGLGRAPRPRGPHPWPSTTVPPAPPV